MNSSFCRVAVAAVALCASVMAANAQERGPVTNLPLPRYVSLKANEANARRGPDTTHRIDWVYKRRDLPLRVTAEFEHWRRVEDMEGQGGWMHYALLSGVRTALVAHDMTQLRARPQEGARELALLELGVIGTLRHCDPDWCEVDFDGMSGWVPKSALWGVAPDEVID
jgi:SH3-like domain-containing protein